MITRRQGLLGALVTGFAALSWPTKAVVASAAGNTMSRQGQGIVGTWTSNDPPQTEGTPAPQRATATYISDGTLVLTNSNFPAVTPAQGVWTPTGTLEFAATWTQFRYDQQGHLAGSAKVRARLRLNEAEDQYTQEVVADLLDVNGNVIETRPSTRAFTRMQVEPI